MPCGHGPATTVQYDLFGEVEAAEQAQARRAELAAGMAAWRQAMTLDCCTARPCPPGVVPVWREGQLIEPAPADPQRREYRQIRCGRCGQLTEEYGLTVNHDLGWLGCPTDGRRQFATAEEMSAGRHDSRHHPPCAGCGHAWGIHTRGWTVAPAEEARCYGWCGCRGYARPAGWRTLVPAPDPRPVLWPPEATA